MSQHDKKHEDRTHQQSRPSPDNQAQQHGQDNVNPSGNQDQFTIEGM